MDTTEPTRLTGLPSWLLTQTAAHAGRLVSEGLAGVEARGYHYRVLATLDEYGPASQADLGRRSGIHLSDLVAAINELAARGYVQRSPTPTTGAATSSPSPTPDAGNWPRSTSSSPPYSSGCSHRWTARSAHNWPRC
ncbi:MarR family winged helix-turn-helix transcriptional regulator [Catellatospora coxensis]